MSAQPGALTLAIYKRHMAAYWTSVWGELLPERITHELVLKRLTDLAQDHLDERTGKVVKGLGRKTQNNILIRYAVSSSSSASAKHHRQPDARHRHPEGGGKSPRPTRSRPTRSRSCSRCYGAPRAKKSPNWFEFAFFAGMRTSEQIALQWTNVDLRTHTAVVKQARCHGPRQGPDQDER